MPSGAILNVYNPPAGDGLISALRDLIDIADDMPDTTFILRARSEYGLGAEITREILSSEEIVGNMEVVVTCDKCGDRFDEVVSLHMIAAGRTHACECPNCHAEHWVVVKVSATVENVQRPR